MFNLVPDLQDISVPLNLNSCQRGIHLILSHEAVTKILN
jgi:hypothetical protein